MEERNCDQICGGGNIFTKFAKLTSPKCRDCRNYNKKVQAFNQQVQKLGGENEALFKDITNYQQEDIGYRRQIEDDVQKQKLEGNLRKSLRALLGKHDVYQDVSRRQKHTLRDYDRYLGYQRGTAGDQLKALDEIERTVSTRDRLTRINQDAYEEKRAFIGYVGSFGIVIILAIFPLVAYLGGYLSYPAFVTMIFSIIVAYLIYMIWVADTGYVKSFTQSAVKDMGILAHDVENGLYVVRDDIANSVFGKSHGVACGGCPDDKIRPEDIRDVVDRRGGEYDVIHNRNAVYYDDGTAPAQSIIPWEDSRVKTDWNVAPDYGSRTSSRYTPQPIWPPSGLPKGGISDHREKGKCLSWGVAG